MELPGAISNRQPKAVAINEICLSQFNAIKSVTGYNGQFVQAGTANCENNLGAYGIAVFYKGAMLSPRDERQYVSQVAGAEKRVLLCVHLHDVADYWMCTTHLSTKEHKDKRDAQTQELQAILRYLSVGENEPLLLMGDLNMDHDDFKSARPEGFTFSGDNKYLIAAWTTLGWGDKTSLSMLDAPFTDHPGMLFTSS